MANEARDIAAGPRLSEEDEGRQALKFQESGRANWLDAGARTPLFFAAHSERYARQHLIREYEELVNANLVVVIDQIFDSNLTYLEELLFDLDPGKPLHVLLASPGGDGEAAIRIVRSMQARCTELTVVVPDMAKSAATLICLGADHIVMGPAGDLGPVDPQFTIDDGRSLVSGKHIVAAVDEAEDRVRRNPESFALFSALLSEVNMLMVEQARGELSRSEALVREALEACPRREADLVTALSETLRAPLIDDPTAHSAVISCAAAAKFGLPAKSADVRSPEWRVIWQLWTRYFMLSCFPAGTTAAYEGRRASFVLRPEGG